MDEVMPLQEKPLPETLDTVLLEPLDEMRCELSAGPVTIMITPTVESSWDAC